MQVDLEAEFRLLANESLTPGGMTVREVASGVAVARDSTSSRIVLVDVGDDPVRVRDRTSAGVWLTTTPQVDGRRWLALECREPRLASVFIALAGEVLREVVEVDPSGRRAVVQGHLERWRELFARGGRDRISRQEEVGLHGELEVLRRFAEVDPNRALDAWLGPQHGQHDFRWADKAIEVKTTEAKDGFTVTVHGLKQLELPSDDSALYLAGVRLLKDPDGRTLPDVVDALLPLVDGPRLIRLLLEVGYDHAGSGEHGWASMIVDRLDIWPVTKETPGLRSSDLPPGWHTAISEVRYRLDLGALGEPLDTDARGKLWTA